MNPVQTREDLAQALDTLGLGPVEFARIVSRVASLNATSQRISQMMSRAKTGRDPSSTVRAVATMLLEQHASGEASAARALIDAGWKPPHRSANHD